MPGLLPDIDPDGLLEYSVVFTDRSLNQVEVAVDLIALHELAVCRHQVALVVDHERAVAAERILARVVLKNEEPVTIDGQIAIDAGHLDRSHSEVGVDGTYLATQTNLHRVRAVLFLLLLNVMLQFQVGSQFQYQAMTIAVAQSMPCP